MKQTIMKQNLNRLCALLLLCVFTSCLYSQTKLVSSRYQLERVSIGEDIGKEEWYAYYLTDDHHAFQKQISGNHLEKLSADNPIFLSRDAEKTFGRSVLSILDKELSNKENGSYDNAAFLAAGNSNRDDIASSLTDGFVGTIDGAGAVSASSDWTAWTR